MLSIINIQQHVDIRISITTIQTLNLQRGKNVVSVSTILESTKGEVATGRAIAAEALPWLGSNPKPQIKKKEGALMKKNTPGAALLPIVPLVLFSTSVFPYEVVSVSGGGTIAGKVAYQGSVPVKKIIPTKDKEVCGGARDEPQVLVGADKGVQDAVVYLKEVTKGKAWAKP